MIDTDTTLPVNETAYSEYESANLDTLGAAPIASSKPAPQYVPDPPPSNKLSLDSYFTFGKHKGKQVEDVLEDYPRYFSWMHDQNVREFDDELTHLLVERKII
jgi:hypothetical protein